MHNWNYLKETVDLDIYTLFARNNICDKICHNTAALSAGIGASLVGAVNTMMLTIEVGAIHRPLDQIPYLFADFNKS